MPQALAMDVVEFLGLLTLGLVAFFLGGQNHKWRDEGTP